VVKGTCDQCKFYHKEFDTIGECHRHPPVVFVVDEDFMSTWPDVRPDHWCGEFKERNPL
jgi:hypothetical protein